MSWFICSRRWCIDRLSPPVKYFYWNVPRRYFFCGSFTLFLSCFVMLSCTSVCWCLVVTCWGKGWPLGSRLWCLIVTLPLSYLDPGSGGAWLHRLLIFALFLNLNGAVVSGEFKAVFSEENYVPPTANRVGMHAYWSLLCQNYTGWNPTISSRECMHKYIYDQTLN